MRKSSLLFASAAVTAALLCCSCQREGFVEELQEIEEPSTGGFVSSISFSVDAFEPEEGEIDTKSTYDASGNFYFAATDTVGIFPAKGSQVYFNIAGEDVGKRTVKFDGGGWGLKENSSYWSYSPLIGDFYLDKSRIPVEFFDLTQDESGSLNHISLLDFIYTDKCEVTDGSLSFVYHRLNCILRPRVTLPAGTYSKIVVQAESDVFVSKGHYDLTADSPSIIGDDFTDHLTLYLENATFTEETAFVGNLMTAPVDISNVPLKVIIYSGDSPVYYYTYERSSAFEANTPYGLRCNDLRIYAEEDATFYTKASAITPGGTYLIVDSEEKRLFKGATDGSFVEASPNSGIIVDNEGTLAAYEFTVENNGSDYYLRFNDGKYLVCDYSNNGAAGLAYVASQPDVTYPYTLTTGENGAFFFSTTQKNDTRYTDQVLYYKAADGAFKIGGSGRSIGVHLYLKEGKQDRGLSFNPSSITCTLGDTPEKPVLSGYFTKVNYSSSDTRIATVDAEGNVRPVAPGIVTITATAEEDDEYYAGSASYTLKVKSASTSGTYVRVTSIDQIQSGGEYVIVYDDGTVQKAFKPVLNARKDAFSTSADNAVDVVVIDDEVDAGAVDACRFTLTNQDGTNKKFSLVIPEADGTTDYNFILYGRESSNSGTMTVFFASPTATGYRSTFALSQDGAMTLTGNSNYVFRYASGSFSAGTGTSSNLYLFVRSAGPAKQKQTLSFPSATVTWTLDEDCEIGRSYDYPQLVVGAKATVTYSSDQESVARVANGKIMVVGAGSATITATAEKTEAFYSATASYTLRIVKAPSEDWVDMGTVSLENRALQDYLDEATVSYSDTDDATNSVMEKYANSPAYSFIDRKDCPEPVTISWANPASSSTVVAIYEDQSLASPIWSQNVAVNSTVSDVYNLIPGRKYYYTVADGTTVWEKGYFETSGRRRMIKVSDVERKGHANNCRDLGGLEVSDNGTRKAIKYGYIFRGTNMDKTTDEEKSLLTGFLNIGMDVDLRNDAANSPGMNDDGNSVCYRPFSSSIYEMGYVNPGFNSFADLTTPEKVNRVVQAIFDTVFAGKAAYFHCYIGADRTGYFAMLIEGLLGVSEKDCSIDYELTSFSEATELRYRTGKPRDYYFRQGIEFLRGQPGDTFQEKIEGYLVNTVGIDKADIYEFKKIVLE